MSAGRYPDDRERKTRARQAAEALFASKPPSAEPSSSRSVPDATPSLPPQQREETLRTASVPEVAAETPIDTSSPASPMIRASQVTRIHTWVKYGMTIREVAEVYGVPVGEVERVLRRG